MHQSENRDTRMTCVRCAQGASNIPVCKRTEKISPWWWPELARDKNTSLVIIVHAIVHTQRQGVEGAMCREYHQTRACQSPRRICRISPSSHSFTSTLRLQSVRLKKNIRSIVGIQVNDAVIKAHHDRRQKYACI